MVAIDPEDHCPAVLSLTEAVTRELYVSPVCTVTETRRRGLPELARALHRLLGEFACGGQDHFYLEGQVALAVPGERDRHGDLFVDPAPDRGSANSPAWRTCSRPAASNMVTVAIRSGAGGGLRRQGEPGHADCRHRWTGLAPQSWPAGQAPASTRND